MSSPLPQQVSEPGQNPERLSVIGKLKALSNEVKSLRKSLKERDEVLLQFRAENERLSFKLMLAETGLANVHGKKVAYPQGVDVDILKLLVENRDLHDRDVKAELLLQNRNLKAELLVENRKLKMKLRKSQAELEALKGGSEAPSTHSTSANPLRSKVAAGGDLEPAGAARHTSPGVTDTVVNDSRQAAQNADPLITSSSNSGSSKPPLEPVPVAEPVPEQSTGSVTERPEPLSRSSSRPSSRPSTPLRRREDAVHARPGSAGANAGAGDVDPDKRSTESGGGDPVEARLAAAGSVAAQQLGGSKETVHSVGVGKAGRSSQSPYSDAFDSMSSAEESAKPTYCFLAASKRTPSRDWHSPAHKRDPCDSHTLHPSTSQGKPNAVDPIPNVRVRSGTGLSHAGARSRPKSAGDLGNVHTHPHTRASAAGAAGKAKRKKPRPRSAYPSSDYKPHATGALAGKGAGLGSGVRPRLTSACGGSAENGHRVRAVPTGVPGGVTYECGMCGFCSANKK